jgi:TetR/AcrR family transcriptional regulator
MKRRIASTRTKTVPKAVAAAVKRAPKLKRREQQRAIDTRAAILQAALTEFARKGFHSASIRDISERLGLRHPLITYHYPTKELLWRAVAAYVFDEIQQIFDERVPINSSLAPLERVREEYRGFLQFTMKWPDFHQFMLRESLPESPRLPWLTKKYLRPILINRLLPHIRAAQKAGELPQGNPVLIHYLMIGVTSVLSSLGPEMELISDIRPKQRKVISAYWNLVEQTVLRR